MKQILYDMGSAPTMVCICGKSPNSDFLGQNGQKKVCIYTKKSEFYHFSLVNCSNNCLTATNRQAHDHPSTMNGCTGYYLNKLVSAIQNKMG